MAYSQIEKQIASPEIDKALVKLLDETAKRTIAALSVSESILGVSSGNSPVNSESFPTT